MTTIGSSNPHGRPAHTGVHPMSRRLKITLPENITSPTGRAGSEHRRARRKARRPNGPPRHHRSHRKRASTPAARRSGPRRTRSTRGGGVRPARAVARALRRRPRMALMDVGRDRRAPRPLPDSTRRPQDGWWKSETHVETLCASSYGVSGSTTPDATPAKSWPSRLNSSTTATSSAKKEAASLAHGHPVRHQTGGSADPLNAT